MRLPAREAILFIEEHRDWILRKRAEVQRRREENDRRRRQQGVQPWQDIGLGNTGTENVRAENAEPQATVPLLADLTGAQKAQIKQKFQEKDEKIRGTDGRDLRSDHDPRSADPMGELQQQGESEFQLSVVLSAGGADGLCCDP